MRERNWHHEKNREASQSKTQINGDDSKETLVTLAKIDHSNIQLNIKYTTEETRCSVITNTI